MPKSTTFDRRDLFISYTKTAANMIGPAIDSLLAQSIQCWVAPRDLQPSLDPREQISKAIRQSKLFCLLSVDGALTNQVKWELELAANHGKRILMVFLTNAALRRLEDNFSYGEMLPFAGKDDLFVARDDCASVDLQADHSAVAAAMEQLTARVQATIPKGVFISYRRGDSASISGRIYDHLIRAFNPSDVFFDVGSIPHHVDFRDFIFGHMQRSAAAIVVIGNKWGDDLRQRQPWWGGRGEKGRIL